MKPKPLDNPEYSKILFLIQSGINTPSELLKHFPKLNPSNLSMKLGQLKKLNFIINKRAKSIKNSSTSSYFIDYKGILNYIFNMLEVNSIEGNIKRLKYFIKNNKEQKTIHNILEDFIFQEATKNKEYNDFTIACFGYFAKVKLKIDIDLLLNLSELDREKIKRMLERSI